MGKSKRNRKKSKKEVFATAPVVEALLAKSSPSMRRNPILIGLAVIVIVIGLYLWLHGGTNNSASQAQSSPGVPQTGLPTVQSGNSQSLSPSGSVNLQPSVNGPQVGSVQ